MRQYELMIILDPELEERTVAALARQVPVGRHARTVAPSTRSTSGAVAVWPTRSRRSPRASTPSQHDRGAGHGQGARPPARPQRVGPADQAPAPRRLSSPCRSDTDPTRSRESTWLATPSSPSSATSPATRSCGSPRPAPRWPTSPSRRRRVTFDRQSNEWKDGETLFMRCSVWREAAENVAESLTTRHPRHRHRPAEVRAPTRPRKARSAPWSRCEVDEVGPSLRYATAKVTKTQRGGGGGGGFGGQQGGGGRRWLRRPAGRRLRPASDPWATGPAAAGGQRHRRRRRPAGRLGQRPGVRRAALLIRSQRDLRRSIGHRPAPVGAARPTPIPERKLRAPQNGGAPRWPSQ